MANIQFGTVIGRFFAKVGDTADVGTEPDEVPLTGTVLFTPNVQAILVPEGTPNPYTALPRPVLAQVTAGVLQFNSTDLKLVATDSPSTLPLNWTYTVTFALINAGVPVPYDSFDISVLSGTVVDLSVIAPVPSSEGVVTTDQVVAALLDGPTLTRAALDEAFEAGIPGTELGYAERLTNFATTAVAAGATALVPGLVVTVTGQGRPVDIEFFAQAVRHSVASTAITGYLEVNGSATASQASSAGSSSPSTTVGRVIIIRRRAVLADGVEYTFKAGIFGGAAGTTTLSAAAFAASHLSVTSR
jgi:hypothetical protein